MLDSPNKQQSESGIRLTSFPILTANKNKEAHHAEHKETRHTAQTASALATAAAESGCVTCHLDIEMLKQTVTVQKGAKSALQSGAG
jgi:hypothetical protein